VRRKPNQGANAEKRKKGNLGGDVLEARISVMRREKAVRGIWQARGPKERERDQRRAKLGDREGRGAVSCARGACVEMSPFALNQNHLDQNNANRGEADLLKQK